MSGPPLLELTGVSKDFLVEPNLLRRLAGRGRTLRAVDDFNLRVDRGDVIGLVGESGCGKTTVALLVLRLLRASEGAIRYRGEDVAAMPAAALKSFRHRVQMVFQDSHSALNPRKTIRRTLLEALRIRHGRAPGLDDRAIALIADTGLGSEVLPRYPHALSGGQRQRVGIARAMAMEPELIVADEPVSSLDVSLQAQIINVFKRLRDAHGLTMMFISHDLALVNHLCNRTVVMYAGRVAEAGPTQEVMRDPAHPYTRALIGSVPRGVRGRGQRRKTLQGGVETGGRGCLFASRCPDAMDICRRTSPAMTSLSGTHGAACHLLTP